VPPSFTFTDRRPDREQAAFLQDQLRLGPVTASVVRSPSEGRAVLVPDRLPEPGAGKTYQMWYVPPQGNPVSAGLLAGTAPTLLEGSGQDAAAVALSVEPTGGSPQPTTTPVLVIPLA